MLTYIAQNKKDDKFIGFYMKKKTSKQTKSTDRCVCNIQLPCDVVCIMPFINGFYFEYVKLCVCL